MTSSREVVDIRDYLVSPNTRAGVYAPIGEKPGIDLVRWAVDLDYEIGMYQAGSWFAGKGTRNNVTSPKVAERELFLHTHIAGAEGLYPEDLPSPEDVFAAMSSRGRNLIAFSSGVTEFALTDPSKIMLHLDKVAELTKFGYLGWLKLVGVKRKLYLWEDLNENKFDKLLSALPDPAFKH